MQKTKESIFELLRREHRDLEARHAELLADLGHSDLPSRAATLLRDLRTHELVETRALGSLLVARVPETAVVRRLERSHQAVDHALQTLADCRDPLEWAETFRALGGRMKEHFRFEQEYVFPATHYLFSSFTEGRMRVRYDRLRRRLPWSRPHVVQG